MKATVDEARGRRADTYAALRRRATATGRTWPWQTAATTAGTSLVGRQSPRASPALDAEHPLMVIYTSGTTGRPKGAVHVHGGFLVKIAQEVGLPDRPPARATRSTG